ncbi:RICIN domain-containing protein [Nonomuraea aurantiaca]|uniref:RICIN domain-containing protein n=1 Tax=Nonomuraea aurantiaca TaxID=2878562 RepID=UPI001CDA092D|nr:RICIN domain-containing protein [Nonomuraea aurantiaca]MCA2225192.1 RICIN domain-containing protein [Nonomuraea aurantiaca]
MNFRATLTALAVLAALGVAAAPAQAATPVAGGTYQLKVTKSGQCLDVTAGSKDNGGLLQQWSCSGDSWQRFTLQLRQSGSVCVSCTGKSTTSGSAFTPGSFYSYTLDPAADVPSLLRTYAGPQANIGA